VSGPYRPRIAGQNWQARPGPTAVDELSGSNLALPSSHRRAGFSQIAPFILILECPRNLTFIPRLSYHARYTDFPRFLLQLTRPNCSMTTPGRRQYRDGSLPTLGPGNMQASQRVADFILAFRVTHSHSWVDHPTLPERWHDQTTTEGIKPGSVPIVRPNSP